jgi:hypothetical protein
MANNPQARNLPTIRFTKRVGDSTLKTKIQGVIESTLDVLAHDLDMSNKTLNVVLTRANTGRTHGHIRVSATFSNPKANLDTMELMLNLGSMRNARDEGDLIKTLMHETIHYVQYQSGILTGEVVGRSWVNTWNLTRATELSRRAQGNRSFITEARPITPQAGDRVETIKRAPKRGTTSYEQYLLMPHERQAWTQVLGLAHQLYPQAVEACRTSARTAYKAGKVVGSHHRQYR